MVVILLLLLLLTFVSDHQFLSDRNSTGMQDLWIREQHDEISHHLHVDHFRNLTLMYVHIGKTGGTTLNTVLRSNCEWYNSAVAKQKCLQTRKGQMESMVSQRTKATMHTQPRKLFHQWIHQTTAFLVTIRNPIDRAVSAFYMEHPLNTGTELTNMHWSVSQFYQDCFPTIQHMAEILQKNHSRIKNGTDMDSNCYDRGKKTLLGKGRPSVASHLRLNYAFYGRHTFLKYPEIPVLVARTETLWEDMMQIDQFLGGNGILPSSGSVHTHGSEKYSISSGLSKQGKKILCCFLATELAIYETLLRRAINLSPIEKEATANRVYDDCGVTNSSLAVKEPIVSQTDMGRTIFAWEKWANNSDSGCLY